MPTSTANITIQARAAARWRRCPGGTIGQPIRLMWNATQGSSIGASSQIQRVRQLSAYRPPSGSASVHVAR